MYPRPVTPYPTYSNQYYQYYQHVKSYHNKHVEIAFVKVGIPDEYEEFDNPKECFYIWWKKPNKVENIEIKEFTIDGDLEIYNIHDKELVIPLTYPNNLLKFNDKHLGIAPISKYLLDKILDHNSIYYI